MQALSADQRGMRENTTLTGAWVTASCGQSGGRTREQLSQTWWERGLAGRLSMPPLLYTAGCNYASGFSWAAPLHVATLPLPPTNQPTNQPKTVLDPELEMCLSLPHSPIGKDSLCPFLPMTDVCVLGFHWLNFPNGLRTGPESRTQHMERGTQRGENVAQDVSI